MRKISSVAIVSGFFLAAACILTPDATPAPGSGPVDTPASTKQPAMDSPEPAIAPTAEIPAATPSPDPTAGFFPIAIEHYSNSDTAVLLGGTENGVWIDADTAASRLSGGEVYNLYSPAGLSGTAVGTKPTKDTICGQYTLQWTPLPGASPAVGLGGGWNALPRLPEDPPISSFETYTVPAEDWVEAQGITVAEPFRLTRILLADLDGDGPMEALISGVRLSENTLHDAAAGDYSMVLLYREATPHIIQLVGDYYPAAKSLAFPKAYSISSVLDLNGDGRMEVIVEVQRWEGGGHMVFAYDGTAVETVFNSVCSM